MDEIFFLKAGDILLTRNPESWVNPTYQARMRKNEIRSCGKTLEFIPTHAAMMLGGGMVIHSEKDRPRARRIADVATAVKLVVEAIRSGRNAAIGAIANPKTLEAIQALVGTGVDIQSIDEFLRGKKAEDVLVLRHPSANNDNFFYKNAIYHLDKPYNFLIEVSDGADVSAFCSQFIHLVFTSSGIQLPATDSHRVLPVDFLIWAHENEWPLYSGQQVIDYVASDLYEPLVNKGIEAGAHIHRQTVHHTLETSRILDILSEFDRMVAEIMGSLGDTTVRPIDMVRAKVQPTSFSAEGVLLAADNLYRHAMGVRNPPGVSTDDIAFPPVGQEACELGWGVSKTIRPPSTDDHQATISQGFLAQSEQILTNFESALGDMIATLTPIIDPLDDDAAIDDETLARLLDSDTYKVFVYTCGCFELSADKEDLENIREQAFSRVTSMTEVLVDTSRLALGLSSLLEEKAADDPEYVSLRKKVSQQAACLANYCLACDFADTVPWVALCTATNGLSGTIEPVLRAAPQAILHCLRKMNENLPRSRMAIRSATAPHVTP